MKNRICVLLFVAACGMGLFACNQVRGGAMATGERVPVKYFFSELPVFMKSQPSVADSLFLDRYAGLLPVYCSGVLGLAVPDSVSYRDILAPFFADTSVMRLYHDVLAEYCDLTDIEIGLGEAFSRWESEFPEQSLPEVAAHVSGFNQSVIVTENFVSIALDKYMGPEYTAYDDVFYDYRRAEMDRSRIVYDVMKVMLYSSFPVRETEGTLLDHMIYEGKVLYALSRLFPAAGEADLIAYSEAQMKWCRENEKEMWKRMTADRQLFSTDGLLRAKYLSPAPYTAPLIRTSPGRAGQWTGWQIVKAYMKKHPKTSLTELLTAPVDEGQRFLKASGYHG